MATLSPPSSSGFFYNFFSEQPPERLEQLDVLDTVCDHFNNTRDGAWDVFRIAETILSWVRFSTTKGSELVGRVSEVANSAGIALCIPSIISNCNDFSCSTYYVYKVGELHYSDPLRMAKITQRVKRCFLDLLNLTNNVTQALLFFDRVKILALKEAGKLNIINSIFNGTSFVLDCIEFGDEWYKRKSYNVLLQTSLDNATATKVREKRNLSQIILLKDVVSIASSSLAMVAFIFGIANDDFILETSGLILGTFWLTLKLTAEFYNRIVVDPAALAIEVPSRTVVPI